MVLSHSVAERVFGDEEPVGRMVTMENGQRRLVVGVVADSHQRSVAAGPSPTVYLPTSWYLWETMTLILRTRGDPWPLVAQLREAAGEVYPHRALYDIRTMEAVVAGSVAGPRLQAAVVGGFALAALLIAAVGIGGVMAYVVARRTPELALRLALGASPRGVRRRLLAGAAARALAGVVIGAAVLGVLRHLWPAVTGVGEVLPVALVATAALMLLAAIASCWLPARRAARIAPAVALRGD